MSEPKDKELFEPGCADSWSSRQSEINGECPVCGTPTVDGSAAFGCNYSPVDCDTCGHATCDLSC